jgi:hypothetical protein
MGPTTKGRTVLIVQYHIMREIEAGHQPHHVEVEVVAGMGLMMEAMEGMMAVIEDHHDHPSGIVEHYEDIPCHQQIQPNIIPPE